MFSVYVADFVHQKNNNFLAQWVTIEFVEVDD